MSTSISRPVGFDAGALQPIGTAGGFGTALAGRRRRRGKRLLSLLLALLAPAALMAAYLYRVADDQFVTEFRFSVRHQTPMHMDATQASAFSAPLSGSAGALSVINDSQIVIQYLKSRQVLDDMQAAGIDLDAVYASDGPDALAHLRKGAGAEEKLRYWRRMVEPFFDLTTGIVSVEVRAFRPQDAKRVAATALGLAERLINQISERAHADMLAYASAEVASAETKLKKAQVAISDYRNKNAVLFPEMQATSKYTVEGLVRQGLIEARTTYQAQLAQGVSADSAHMRMLSNRIAAMESEISGVHGQLAQSGGTAAGAAAPAATLASVLSGYGVLQVEEEIAAKVYERALMSLQDARYAASEQAVYLAAFVQPGLPQDSTWPLRWRVMLETVLVSFAAWCLLQLIYHGVRDHLD